MIYRSYQKPVVIDLKSKGWDDDTIMMHGKGILIDQDGNLYEG